MRRSLFINTFFTGLLVLSPFVVSAQEVTSTTGDSITTQSNAATTTEPVVIETKKAPATTVKVTPAGNPVVKTAPAGSWPLLDLKEGNFKYARIPDIKLPDQKGLAVKNSESDNVNKSVNVSGDDSNTTGFLSSQSALIVIVLIVVILIIVIIFRSRRHNGGRSVLRRFPK